MTGSDSSRQLLARFRQGEGQAAAEIFDRYVARLLALVRGRISPRMGRRIDAEDVVQSGLRSFFVRANCEEYVLQRAGDLWRLLAAITLSKLRRQVEVHTAAKRAVSREQPTASDANLLASIADGEPLPEEEAILQDELQWLLAACSPAEQEALQLRLAGETIESIAAALGRSQRTVRRLLLTARQTLERRLQEAERELP